jgi:hypothetical protein
MGVEISFYWRQRILWPDTAWVELLALRGAAPRAAAQRLGSDAGFATFLPPGLRAEFSQRENFHRPVAVAVCTQGDQRQRARRNAPCLPQMRQEYFDLP